MILHQKYLKLKFLYPYFKHQNIETSLPSSNPLQPLTMLEYMNNQTIMKNCDDIIISIKDRYDCAFYLENDFIDCFYLAEPGSGKTGDRGFCDLVSCQREVFITMSFKLKIDLLPEDVKVEASKFTITQPTKSWKDGPYEVIIHTPETITSYYIWAKYQETKKSDCSNPLESWKKYTPGDEIIGEPIIRKETTYKSPTGKTGTTIMFKILRPDLVEHPINILHLERFLAKYCPLKLEKSE